MKNVSKVFLFLITAFLFFGFNLKSEAKINSKYEVHKGKSFFVLSDFKKSANLSWKSSNRSIAEVNNGIVYGKNEGIVQISSIINGTTKEVCTVTVLPPEDVRFAFSSINSAKVGENINLTAIVDKNVQAVHFKIIRSRGNSVINAVKKSENEKSYTFSGSTIENIPGKYSVEIYVLKNGSWTKSSKSFTIFVSKLSSSVNVTSEELQVSEKCIKLISLFEGFTPSLKKDILVSNTYNIGFGTVIHEGKEFYNNLTNDEALALLREKVNNGLYTSSVNKMLISNGIQFSQNQFDALISFSYNLGPAWTNQSKLKDIILACKDKKLDLIDKNSFINEFLKYHHAAKKCIPGLLNRRISELQIFLHCDYSNNGKSNKYHFPIPECYKANIK